MLRLARPRPLFAAAVRALASSSALPPRPPPRGPRGSSRAPPPPPPLTMQPSVARVYADVNEKKPREYWDYEAVTVEWG